MHPVVARVSAAVLLLGLDSRQPQMYLASQQSARSHRMATCQASIEAAVQASPSGCLTSRLQLLEIRHFTDSNHAHLPLPALVQALATR